MKESVIEDIPPPVDGRRSARNFVVCHRFCHAGANARGTSAWRVIWLTVRIQSRGGAINRKERFQQTSVESSRQCSPVLHACEWSVFTSSISFDDANTRYSRKSAARHHGRLSGRDQPRWVPVAVTESVLRQKPTPSTWRFSRIVRDPQGKDNSVNVGADQ